MVDSGEPPATERPLCASCSADLLGGFCHLCGEKRLAALDRSLRHYTGELVEGLFNVDSKLWRSVRALILRPGLLTADYWRGRRVRYMKPLPLFLLANVLYFLLASWVGLSAVPFHYMIRQPTNLSLVERKLEVPPAQQQEFRQAAALYARSKRDAIGDKPGARQLQTYAQRYDTTAPLLSRSLVLILIILFTPLLAVTQIRRRHRFPLAAHLLFATHFMTVFLLAFLATEWFWRGLRAVTGFRISGDALLVALPPVLAMGSYLYFGLRRFYEERRIFAAAKAVLLVIGMAYLFLTYQRLLFYVTLLFT